MTDGDDPRVLMVPMHPGIQYHFARVGLPTYILGNWSQFQYWRPKPPNVVDLLAEYKPEQLSYGPDDYRRLLSELVGYPTGFELAWMHFPWQLKLFWGERRLPKVYFAAKEDELSEATWNDVLQRPDITVASYYPRTTQWVRDRFGASIEEIRLGLDPEDYSGWTGEESCILTVIHSWKDRGWRRHVYCEAVARLPALHVDHLDKSKPHVGYGALKDLFRSSRVYLHDGEREYTIVLIEAMMTGMPIVTFRLPGIEDYVEHGVNGFVGTSATEIRDYCRMLLSDRDLATQFGRASRNRGFEEPP